MAPHEDQFKVSAGHGRSPRPRPSLTDHVPVSRGKESVSAGLALMEKESSFKPIKGEILVRLEDARSGKTEQFSMPNIVVKTASVLIAALMKSALASGLQGIQYLAVGSGAPEWDPMSPPQATVDQTRLENEILRKPFASCSFIDSEGAVSEVPTNIVDFTTVFEEGEAVAPLVEMGLVGGNATSVPYSGILVNYRTFRVINKPSTAKMTIVWRLTF